MIFDSISFRTWSVILGVLFLAAGSLNLIFPGRSSAWARTFPRSKPCDYLLSSLAFLWAAALVFAFPIDFLAHIRVYATILVIASIPVSWWLMPDLLGSRAIGGLLVLLPAPVLQVARYCDTEWRFIVIVPMYICVVAGMALILYPHHLRDALSWLSETRSRMRTAGVIFAVFGLLLLAFGLLSF